MSRIEPKFKERWGEIATRNYAGQAKWMLNGFWDELQGEAESIFKLWQKICELDIQNKKEGRDLDEFYAHKFLESLGETLTVIALRERLRQIDLDNNNRMSFLEYLVFKYKKTVEQVVNSPQGDNRKEIEEASRLLELAQQALDEMQSKLQEQKRLLEAQKQAEKLAEDAYKASEKAKHEAEVALEAQKKVEAELKAAEDEVRSKENAARAAEDENKAALAELHKQEEDYKNKIATLEKATQEGTVVQKNKAANELAQLKGEDPLPLRKAKITQESAVRKAEKARKEAEQATAEAKAKTDEAKAKTAEAKSKADIAAKAKNEAQRTLEASKQARLEAEESTRQVEAATKDAENKFQEAQDFLEEAKKKAGSCHGDLWWMDREIKEAKKYLPKSKQ